MNVNKNGQNTTMKSIVPNSTKFNKSTMFNKDFRISNVSNIPKNTQINLPNLPELNLSGKREKNYKILDFHTNFDDSILEKSLIEKEEADKKYNLISNVYKNTIKSNVSPLNEDSHFHNMDQNLGDVNTIVTVHNSTILNSSNHNKNDKHEKNKSYCPFCEHCNSSIEDKNDVFNLRIRFY